MRKTESRRLRLSRHTHKRWPKNLVGKAIVLARLIWKKRPRLRQRLAKVHSFRSCRCLMKRFTYLRTNFTPRRLKKRPITTKFSRRRNLTFRHSRIYMAIAKFKELETLKLVTKCCVLIIKTILTM